MQDLNSSPAFVQTVVDVKRRVEKPSDVRMSFYGSADVREGLEQIDVVEKIIGELFGCIGMVLSRPIENSFQIG